MQRNGPEEKTAKTALLVGAANILTLPFFAYDTGLGLAAMAALNSFILYSLHSYGKERRAGSNLLNTGRTFFAAHTNTQGREVENTFRNIINGGAAVTDELAAALAPAPGRR